MVRSVICDCYMCIVRAALGQPAMEVQAHTIVLSISQVDG